MTINLITKYRPETLDEVVGQSAVVNSLKTILKKKDVPTFLFYGPSGCGKTTLSRIVARGYGCDDSAILDIDAASKTGVDDMRAVQEVTRYRSFGNSGKRAIIIDECHRLSGNAFDSLLKTLEEPPPHVVWCFCTTNPGKVPKTLKTRAAAFELKLVNDKDLGKLYDIVADEEKLDIPDDVIDLLIIEAKGSPRQLLSNIVVARTAKTKQEAATLLKTAIETDASLELCRWIAEGRESWAKGMLILKRLENESPEGLRIIIANYLAACAKGAKDDKTAIRFLGKLDPFTQPYTGLDGFAPLIIAMGRAMFSE